MNTPLHIAITYNHVNAVQMLIDMGANVHLTHHNTNRTYMHHVALTNNPIIAQMLFDHGCDVNRSDRWGNTPIHITMQYNSIDMLQWLLNKGVNPNSGNIVGSTPLHTIMSHNRYHNITSDVGIKLLLSRGANINQPDIGGDTPLHVAYKCQRHRTAQILIEHGADIHIRNKRGFIPDDYWQSISSY